MRACAIGFLAWSGAAAARLAPASAMTWTGPMLIDHARPLGAPQNGSSVSCPSPSMCGGDVAFSRRPARGASAWKLVPVPNGLGMQAVSCESESLRVASAPGKVLWSRNPLARAAEPAPGTTSSSERPTSCSGSRVEHLVPCCDAVRSGRRVGKRADVARPGRGGARAWSAAHLDGAAHLSGGLACPSVTFCLAVDNAGDVLTAQQPTGGAAASTVTKSGVARL
jgi:hypothetical protein